MTPRAMEALWAPFTLRTAFFESSTQPGTSEILREHDTCISTVAQVLLSPHR